MSKYKRPWKTVEELKDEEWDLNVMRSGVLEDLKFYIADNVAAAESDSKDIDLFINIVDMINKYGNILKRLSKELDDVKEEIKEREDEENQITADNL